MPKAIKPYVVLLLLLTFAFGFRLLLMLWEGYPPGADIGLHNSVIYSITGSGNVDFLYNSYHIGGGLSLTFPGYHIFTSSVMMLTGTSDYIAHAIVVSLFSSLIVLSAFLITRRVWSLPAAYIAAFLVAISRFDIEMLMWGGYPNIITLFLIPLAFYMYLEKDRFSPTPFLVTASLLAGTIFLTHSLSAAIFVTITVLTVLFVLVKPRMFSTPRETGLFWLLPIIFGAILFASFLVEAVPAYLKENASLASGPASANIASQAIKLATLSTRILPLELVLPLFGVLLGFIIFSKKYHRKSIALPTFLLVIWLFVPLVLTLGYVIGLAIDFNRFLYFLILPLIIFIAVLIDHGSGFFARVIESKYNPLTGNPHKVGNLRVTRFMASLSRKKIYGSFIVFFLLFTFVALPIFMGPLYYNSGQTIQSFYQTMNNEGWEAMQWAKNSTPTDAVFVSDALYGWWLGGFAQRRTYSAVDPQYLSIKEEYNKTLFARNLLDTDFLVDNGLVQIREDGGYIARHNPEILATLNWTYFPYSFFTFGSDQTQIRYEVNGTLNEVMLDQLAVKEMQLEKNVAYYNQSHVLEAAITVTRGNDYFNYTQTTTVYRGSLHVNLTTTINTSVPGVSLHWVDIDVESKGIQIPYGNSKTIGLLDEGVKALGQLIFTTKPYYQVVNERAGLVNLHYVLDGKSQMTIEILATAYSIDDDPEIYSSKESINNFIGSLMTKNLESYLDINNLEGRSDLGIDFVQVFDYNSEIQSFDVSYVACREPEMYPKFSSDPLFSLVFINEEVAIFKVNGEFNQG